MEPISPIDLKACRLRKEITSGFLSLPGQVVSSDCSDFILSPWVQVGELLQDFSRGSAMRPRAGVS